MSLIVRAVCATKLPTLTFDDNRRFRDLLQVSVMKDLKEGGGGYVHHVHQGVLNLVSYLLYSHHLSFPHPIPLFLPPGSLPWYLHH